MDHNEEFRFGSAKKASDKEIDANGMFDPSVGPYQVTMESGCDVFNSEDGSTLIMAGPRSLKTAGFYMRAIPHSIRELEMNGLINDPRGEITAMLSLYCTVHSVPFFSINFGQFDWAPHFRANVWEHITPDSPTRDADCLETMFDAIPLATGSDGKSKWWEDDARSFGVAILCWLTLRDGAPPSPKKFYQFLNLMTGDLERWASELERMLVCSAPLVPQFANDVMQRQQGTGDSFSAPMSTLAATFAFCKAQHYADAVSISDFPLADLADPDKRMMVAMMPPFQHMALLAPALRMVISSVIRAKLQNPGGRRVGFWLDEAGQLGVGFRRIPELFTFAGGAGCYTAAAYQEPSMVFRCMGSQQAGNELIGSAQWRQFRSIGSAEGASMVSRMAGDQTLEYNQSVDQSLADMQRRKAAQQLLKGGSLAETAAELQHQTLAAEHRTKMHRRLFTESEVLSSKQVFAFATRLLDGPITGRWVPVFDDRSLNGLILNNPYHADTVRMRKRFDWRGKPRYANVPIVEAEVPDQWVHLPQYAQDFKLRYPKGHFPKPQKRRT